MTVPNAATAQIVASIRRPIIRKKAARTSWRITWFISLPPSAYQTSIVCATRSYRSKETSDHASSANAHNRGSVWSIPAFSRNPRIHPTFPHEILQDVPYKIALFRPSVLPGPGLSLQRAAPKIYAAFGGEGLSP